MSNVKVEYGAASQAITISLNNLASGSSQESTAVDNTSNKFLDAILYLGITESNSAPSGEKVIKVFFYCSEDGTNYTSNATGTDASLTLPAPTNLLGPFLIQVPTANLLYKIILPSVASFFGGVLPPKWGIVIQNATGQAFASSGHTVEYRGVYNTVT